jgi:uncharacterized protein (DUF58 family)
LKLTQRGKLSVAILIGLAFSAVLFSDIIIFFLFVGTLILVDSELAWMAVILYRPNKFLVLNRDSKAREQVNSKNSGLSKSVPLGEVSGDDFSFTIKARSSVTLSTSDTPYLKLNPTQFKRNTDKTKVHLEFRSPYTGIYEVDHVKANVLGPLCLFETDVKLNLSLNYRVYPKVYDVALTSSKILEKGGIGETPIEFPGIGSEFFDTREYVSGDDIRHVNWKATARLGELIVNDRAKEIGATYYLVLDSNSQSYFDRDRLATTFLQIANILTILGANFGFIVHDGNKISSFKEIDRPYTSLELARKAALGIAEISQLKVIEEKLVPLPSHKIRTTRDLLSKQGLTLLSEIEGIAQQGMISTVEQNNAFSNIMNVMKDNSSEPPTIVYISGLFSSIAPIIEISSELKRSFNADFIVAVPTMPWIVALDENQAAKLYEAHLKNLKILATSGVQYYTGEPLKIAEQLLI